MSACFLKSKYLGWNLKVELDLFNYVSKADLRNATGGETLSFAEKTDWVNLNTGVDKLDIDKIKYVPNGLISLKGKKDKWDIGKLEAIPFDLCKLNNVVKTLDL